MRLQKCFFSSAQPLFSYLSGYWYFDTTFWMNMWKEEIQYVLSCLGFSSLGSFSLFPFFLFLCFYFPNCLSGFCVLLCSGLGLEKFFVFIRSFVLSADGWCFLSVWGGGSFFLSFFVKHTHYWVLGMGPGVNWSKRKTRFHLYASTHQLCFCDGLDGYGIMGDWEGAGKERRGFVCGIGWDGYRANCCMSDV